MCILETRPESPIFVVEKKPIPTKSDDLIDGEACGVGGKETIEIWKAAEGYRVYYLVGLRTSKHWTSKHVDALFLTLSSKGDEWRTAPGFQIMKSFFVSGNGDFWDVIYGILDARRLKLAYTAVYDELCAGKDFEDRPKVGAFAKAVKERLKDMEPVSIEKSIVSLDDFKKKVKDKGFVRHGQGAG